jgi:putative methyltransferase (TIGR04325 family)
LNRLKILVVDILPPIVLRVLMKLFRPHTPRLFGVFHDVNMIQNQGQYESKEWLDQQTKALRENIHPWEHLPEMHSPRALTALYLNLISRKQQISVLDFGGASGEIYFDLKRGGGLLYPNNVIWTVVDSLPGMQLGENFMIEGDQIDFSTTIPPEKHFDVLHVSTVFQYIPDIVGTVNNLLDSCTPDHIILTRLCAGSNPDFFTRNYAFGKWEAVHFFNFNEFERQFHKRGFESVLRQKYSEESLSPADFDGVPADFQISSTAHLILTRTSL